MTSFVSHSEDDAPVVIELLDHPAGRVYLRHYDPDAHQGRGWIDVTHDLARAKRYPTMSEALEEWQRPSTVQPLRIDGKPNRPLSAHTVTFQRAWR